MGARPGLVGRGIAIEAGRAVRDWTLGPLGFVRAVSITTEPNLASRAVMAKLGFTLRTRIDSEWGELWVHARDARHHPVTGATAPLLLA